MMWADCCKERSLEKHRKSVFKIAVMGARVVSLLLSTVQESLVQVWVCYYLCVGT